MFRVIGLFNQAWLKPEIFQKAVLSQNFLYSLNTRYFLLVDREYYVTNLLKTEQAALERTGTVLEWTSLILDLLAISRFDHACFQ